MLTSVNELRGFEVVATDGRIGAVDDFLFQDPTWVIRYAVVDTGVWLPGRAVLLSPASVCKLDRAGMRVHVNLTKSQVANAPAPASRRGVTRRHEEELADYYDWPRYWEHGLYQEWQPYNVLFRRRGPGGDADATPLRSIRDLTGYKIHAADGHIGHIDDFVAKADDWLIRYLVADTRNFLPGRRVLVTPEWVTAIDWERRALTVDLDRESIRHAPEYNPAALAREELKVGSGE